jgi:hypothetical protein
MWEWYCDVSLTAKQRDQLESAFTRLWKKRQKAANRQALERHHALETEWQALQKMEGEDRERRRAQRQAAWIDNMRQAKDDVCLLLVPIYDAAYKPGGARNPIVVAGDPPLTQQMLDIETAFLECVFDLALTPQQRAEHQRLYVEKWKGLDKERRDNNVKGNKTFAKLPAYRDYDRHLTRALNFPRMLKACSEALDDPICHWFMPLYEARARPGSERNSVLAEGKPPLTQLLMDHYGDYLEVMLDLSTSGGFTKPQRQVLQDFLVKDWAKLTAAERDELLGDLKRWEEAAGQGVEQAKQSLSALRPKLLARLNTSRGDARSQWLLEIAAAERKKAEQVAKNQQMMFEAMRFIIHKLDDGSHWERRPDGRMEWVPGR